jgi:hypothetical protein
MALQLTNEEKELFDKELTSAKEEIIELKSLAKVTNKVQSILIDEVENLKHSYRIFQCHLKKNKIKEEKEWEGVGQSLKQNKKIMDRYWGVIKKKRKS